MLSVPQRYRQTDRQTDGRTTYDSNTALALRASRGKNGKFAVAVWTLKVSMSQSEAWMATVTEFQTIWPAVKKDQRPGALSLWRDTMSTEFPVHRVRRRQKNWVHKYKLT